MHRPVATRTLAVFALVAASISAAFAAPARPSALPLAEMAGLHIPMPAQSAHGKIKHVVIIMQENRGFDNLFQGYPGADTKPYGYASNGTQIPLQPVPLEAPYDLEHDIYSFITDYNFGKMNGFNNEYTSCYSSCPYYINPQYGYVPQSEVQTYFNMAGQYVLADRMFTSHIDDSFISHQYIIAAQANHTGSFPSSVWGCDGGPSDIIYILSPNRTFGGSHIPVCWDVNTLGDELDKAKKPWRFYTSSVYGDGGIWSSYQVIKHIRYGPDWNRNIIVPQKQILNDVPNGQLGAVTWVLPTCETSDHAGCGSNLGPSWVASVVNAIGKSKFWSSTAIFITWDEWGGWSDHVPPPYLDYDGLGMRVPLLIISPYAKQGYVSHVQYEQGSILRFAEDQFGLGRLADADKRANSPAVDAFDFSQSPRPFTPFATKVGPEFFLHEKPDRREPDSE